MPLALQELTRSPLFALNRNRMPIARQARRRRNGWPDREAARQRYAKHPGFARWASGVLEDYLEGGLKAAGAVHRKPLDGASVCHGGTKTPPPPP